MSSIGRDGWAWGVDCGSRRAGLGFISVPTGHYYGSVIEWRSQSTEAPSIAAGLAIARKQLIARLPEFLEDFPPATIAFERPSGVHPNPSLMMHAGVIVQTIGELAGLNPWGFNGAPEWRPIIGLRGMGPKLDVVEWATRLGLDYEHVSDIDVLEGVAIAAAGAKEYFGIDPSTLRSTRHS